MNNNNKRRYNHNCCQRQPLLLLWLLFSWIPIIRCHGNHNDLRYIIQYKNEMGRNIVLQASNTIYYEFRKDQYLVVDVSTYDEVIELQQNENIESVEYDGIYMKHGGNDGGNDSEIMINLTDPWNRLIPEDDDENDASIVQGEQIPYAIPMIQADQISYNTTNRAVVCIVDSGVDTKNLDFDISLLDGANRTSSYGQDVYWNNDTVGHGTCLSGIINANSNNNIGIRGVGTIPIYMVRGLNDDGVARESDIRDALGQCEQYDGVKVINLSITGSSMTSLLRTIIDRLYDTDNMVLVASSGNGGSNATFYPAAYNKVISVGAVNGSQLIWQGSNYGPYMELVAPGTGILCLGLTKTAPDKVASYTGTSMAAPYVAGAIALLFSHYPQCTPTQIRYALAYTAKDNGPTGCDDKYGYGIIQIKNAYDFLQKFPCTTSTTWGQNIGNGSCSIIDVVPPIQPQAPIPISITVPTPTTISIPIVIIPSPTSPSQTPPIPISIMVPTIPTSPLQQSRWGRFVLLLLDLWNQVFRPGK